MDNKRLVINPKKNLQNLKEIGEIQGQIKNCTPEELQILAKDQVKQIDMKIQEASRKIVRAKELAYKAKNIENSLIETLNPFAKSETDKKLEALSEADIANAEAIGAQNELIQETIKLICCDMVFANLMIEEMSLIIAEQNNIHRSFTSNLSDDTKQTTKELTQTIIYQAQQRIVEMQKTKQEIQETKEDIKDMEDDIKKLEERLNKKRQVDDEQHRLIEMHYQEFINFKIQMENDTKEKENKISDLKFKISKKNTAFSIIISSLALIVSIVAIILQFIK
ncbi:hypothetical protein [Campylobacter coli]|uniref:hypothetical protein n=1 Tax=Campylobacter coli TaxID=195 RepID=UPI0018FE3A84|nr:hypothetical protein [Campylobacter coli]